jgi:hypothetical protein
MVPSTFYVSQTNMLKSSNIHSSQMHTHKQGESKSPRPTNHTNIYMYIYVYTYIYVCVCEYVYINVYICMCVCVHKHVFIHAGARYTVTPRIYKNIYTHIITARTYIYMCGHMRACMYVHVKIKPYKNTTSIHIKRHTQVLTQHNRMIFTTRGGYYINKYIPIHT